MKAKLSILVEDLRGKAGNVVGKQSQSGQIMMVRSIGRDPKSQTQINPGYCSRCYRKNGPH